MLEEGRRAAASPDAETVVIESLDGEVAARLVVRRDGRAYLLPIRLPNRGGPYSLYALVGETRLLLGQVTDATDALAFRLPDGLQSMVVTDAAGATVASSVLPDLAAPTPDGGEPAPPTPGGTAPPATPTPSVGPGSPSTAPPLSLPPVDLPDPGGGLPLPIPLPTVPLPGL